MSKTPLLLALLLFAGCNDVKEAHDQIHGATHLLAAYDTDGDGALSKDELANAGGHAAMAADHFDSLDLDGDGNLDADELQQHTDGVSALHADRGAAFCAAADTDHDGKLTVSELNAAPDPGPMCVSHLAMIDTDADGAITEAELAAAI